jgi:hypothetical protein
LKDNSTAERLRQYIRINKNHPYYRIPVGRFATNPVGRLPHTHWLFCRNRYAVNMNNATGNT